VLVDAETPADIRVRIDGYERMTPVWIDGPLDDSGIQQIVANTLDDGATHLITTRLDNDDAVASDFVEQTQRAFTGQDREYLNFPIGYQWRDGRLYHTIQRSNPFVSYVERLPADGTRLPTTVYSGGHDLLRRSAGVRQLWRPQIWSQVLHGSNVLNDLQGIRRVRFRPPPRFPDLRLVQEDYAARGSDVVRSLVHLARLGGRRAKRLQPSLRAR
jgi:hypothetical protein